MYIMKNGGALQSILFKIRKFYQGRYGHDKLNRSISYFALALCVVSFFIRSYYFTIAILLLIAVTMYRSLSKNFTRRRYENQVYEYAMRPVRRYFKYFRLKIKSRKTHHINICSKCNSFLRTPKNESGGNMEITCPKCGESFTRRMIGTRG